MIDMRLSLLRVAAISLIVSGLSACGSSPSRGGDESPPPEGDTSSTPGSGMDPLGEVDEAPSGQTGSIGTPPLAWTDAGCRDAWDAGFSQLESPESPWTLESSTCAVRTFPATGESVQCTCEFVETERGIPHTSVLSTTRQTRCQVFSRKFQCLMEPEEFNGCDVERPDASCAEPCQLVADRHNAIDVPASDTAVLATRIGKRARPGGGCGTQEACYVVGRIDDRCVVGDGGPGMLFLETFDCSFHPRARS